jgi:hypothetical protein
VISLISGGSRGLGLAIVERLLARGDRVATFSRSGSPALAALAAAHPDQLLAESLDGCDTAAVIGFVGRVVDRFGGLDHCIANAAIAHEGVLATMRDDEIDALLTVNVKASIVLVRECVRQMLARAQQGEENGGWLRRCLPPFSGASPARPPHLSPLPLGEGGRRPGEGAGNHAEPSTSLRPSARQRPCASPWPINARGRPLEPAPRPSPSGAEVSPSASSRPVCPRFLLRRLAVGHRGGRRAAQHRAGTGV